MITVVGKTHNIDALVKYLYNEKNEGKGHDGSDKRNLYVESVGMIPSDSSRGYLAQFHEDLALTRSNHKVQARHLIFSADPSEIPFSEGDDLENEYNAIAFAELVKGYLSEQYSDRKCLIFIQADNEKHLMHAHVVVCDADITGKGLELSHAEKAAHMRNKTSYQFVNDTFTKYCKDAGMTLVDPEERKGLNPKRRYLNGRLFKQGDKTEEGKYISYWDAIKDKIQECIDMSSSIQEYRENLYKVGLEVTDKHSNKYGDYQQYTLMDLTCLDKVPKSERLSMRSYKHDGMSLSDIEAKINEKNAVLQEEQAQLPVSEPVKSDTEPVIPDELQEKLHGFKLRTQYGKNHGFSIDYAIRHATDELSAEDYQGFEDMMAEVSAEQQSAHIIDDIKVELRKHAKKEDDNTHSVSDYRKQKEDAVKKAQNAAVQDELQDQMQRLLEHEEKTAQRSAEAEYELADALGGHSGRSDRSL